MTDPIVGIDLGTSNSVVAHADATGEVTVLADGSGSRLHPSVVSFHPDGGVVVGAAAKQRKVVDPANTISSVKRLIGRSYHAPEVQTARARVAFQIKEGPGSAPLIVTRAGDFAVPEISAIVLDHVRNIAAERLAAPVSRAVITVPASFGDAQRSATATAGAIAGLTVVRVLNEPTAAALAYGHRQKLHEIIAVYDFGGGTFDITLLRLEDQVYEVLGTAGDTFLGGDDLDERLVDRMVARFLAENRIDLRTSEVAMMRLRAVAEQTKIELSRRSRAVVRIDEIAYGPRGAPLNLQIEVSRDELVGAIADLVDRTFPVCSEALALAQLSPDRIADVILVGGTTKMPYVRDQVAAFFGKPPRTDVNPDDAVAAGAALQATSLERILSRRSSGRHSVPPAPRPETAPPHDAAPRPRRMTAQYAATSSRSPTDPASPDTSYAVNHGGIRDATSGPVRAATPVPVRIDDRTPAPIHQTQPIGRILRPAAAVPPGTPTLIGAAAAPRESDLAPDGFEAADRSAPARRSTSSGTASPPPLPRGPGRPPTVRPPPPGSSPTSEPVRPPSEPRRTSAPSRGWPTPDAVGDHVPASAAETLRDLPSHDRGSSERGVAPPPAPEPSPAATFRGFEPPPRAQVPPWGPVNAPPPAVPGPALQAPVLLEVTPRGLGIATVAGFCEELIRRNARLPTETRKLFTTSRDLQDLVRIVVCQGESRRLDHNTVIGDLVLQGLPRRPRGETTIEVTFALDASGVLQVRARDAATGSEQRARLDLVGGLAQEEVAASRDRLQRLRG